LTNSFDNTPVIVSAVRTAIGKIGRSLKDVPAPRLGAIVIREGLARAKRLTSKDINEVIMGNVVSAGLGQSPARQASMFAGLSANVGGTTVNKVCGSGLKSIMFAAQAIKARDADCIAAGGMESMSQCPYLLKDMRWGARFGDSKASDSMILDGLWDAYNNYHMGITGEIIGEKYKITREEADEFALRSYRNAIKAIDGGTFKQEIVPVEVKQPDGRRTFEIDECVRRDTTLTRLKGLKPVFKSDGILTAGNSSQLSDGAAAVIVTSEAKARAMNLEIIARIVEYGQAAVKPELTMEAPIPASKAVMKKAGLTVNDLDLVEHNEAYATASIAVQRELGVPDKKFNINGGAIALGHPLGCSGARLLTTMIFSLRRRKEHRGLVTLCLGGGEAVSMILET
jgi:acetyl-CoA C-acetyltransferase